MKSARYEHEAARGLENALKQKSIYYINPQSSRGFWTRWARAHGEMAGRKGPTFSPDGKTSLKPGYEAFVGAPACKNLSLSIEYIYFLPRTKNPRRLVAVFDSPLSLGTQT